jgi:hypothetical protein
MQNSNVAEKSSKNAKCFKDYVFPSGRIDRIQGTENLALDELLREGIHEDDIVTSRKEVPVVWYEDENGKKHRYYIDIYIKSQDRGIEAKSKWTAEKQQDNIFIKQEAFKNTGHKICEIWVYDDKNKKVKCHK